MMIPETTTDELASRCNDLIERIRQHISTNDFDTLELLHMTTLLNEYSTALDNCFLNYDDELATDLLACSTNDHLTNGI